LLEAVADLYVDHQEIPSESAVPVALVAEAQQRVQEMQNQIQQMVLNLEQRILVAVEVPEYFKAAQLTDQAHKVVPESLLCVGLLLQYPLTPSRRFHISMWE
jgi:hypothetical protein